MSKHLAVAAALVMATVRAASAQSASGSATVSTSIQEALEVVVSGSTSFGTVVNTSHDEFIDPRAPTAGQTTAQFTIRGGPAVVLVNPGACPIALTRTGGTETMSFFHLFSAVEFGDPNQSGNQSFSRILGECWSGGTTSIDPTSAVAFLWLGGRLAVGANQVPGSYSGTQTITLTAQ